MLLAGSDLILALDSPISLPKGCAMRIFTRKMLTICGLLLSLMTGCSCLQSDVREELNHNPMLRRFGVETQDISVTKGYVGISIKKGLSSEAMCAIQEGKSLREISKFDPSVETLIDLEDSVIKRIPAVKGIEWSAVCTRPNGDMVATGGGVTDEVCYKEFLPQIIMAIIGAIIIAGLIIFSYIRKKQRLKAT